jgi:DNA-directed RNA polymerase
MNPVEYLTERVGAIVLDSAKIYNHGCLLIAHHPGWVNDLEMFVSEAWDVLARYCIRNKNETHSASVKLTFASNLIGKRLTKHLSIDDSNIKSTLALGDLMLESFLQEDLIDIFREYDGFKAPYMVKIRWHVNGIKPALIGTTFEKPLPIKGLISTITKEPYIKGWNSNERFIQYLDSRFIKAIEVLRQQPWCLNEEVLEAARHNPPQSTIELVDPDGEIITHSIHSGVKLPKGTTHIDGAKYLGKRDPKLQRLISKYYEYNQIIRKADIIKQTGYPFYQEISCDYRGRMYYAESFLEFQGSDFARSLFMFENKKLVTEEGYEWMCIHAANCYNQSYTIDQLNSITWLTTDYAKHLGSEGLDTISLDKMTLKDRAAWAYNNMELITSYSLHGTIDRQAEKPYSFLAVCNEIISYIQAEFNDLPYESGLPIPIDGSNNGWQHLAAMSKDRHAGELVSLVPTPIQKDFYVAVAKELITLMPDWFAEKQMPMKAIRKGIAKRGSMTRAYSAGKQRIAKNMYDDCHVEGYTTKYNIDEDQCNLLAGNLITAINTVCDGPLKTSKYLQKIAEHELNNDRTVLEWTTPSGFPVIYKAYLQHEFKQRGTIKGIKGNKDGRVTHVVRIDITNKETGGKVACRRSFASGISPNVVHSYDAAHMANTIVAFNGSFAAVHDSFSCHASDVPFLQDTTKITFQAQYDVPNFFDILQDNLMQHKDTFTLPQPKLGSLDLADLTNSKYFFC